MINLQACCVPSSRPNPSLPTYRMQSIPTSSLTALYIHREINWTIYLRLVANWVHVLFESICIPSMSGMQHAMNGFDIIRCDRNSYSIPSSSDEFREKRNPKKAAYQASLFQNVTQEWDENELRYPMATLQHWDSLPVPNAATPLSDGLHPTGNMAGSAWLSRKEMDLSSQSRRGWILGWRDVTGPANEIMKENLQTN